jgi:hypothetical protein
VTVQRFEGKLWSFQPTTMPKDKSAQKARKEKRKDPAKPKNAVDPGHEKATSATKAMAALAMDNNLPPKGWKTLSLDGTPILSSEAAATLAHSSIALGEGRGSVPSGLGGGEIPFAHSSLVLGEGLESEHQKELLRLEEQNNVDARRMVTGTRRPRENKRRWRKPAALFAQPCGIGRAATCFSGN